MSDPTSFVTAPWRTELPTLTGRMVTLREPAAQDLGPLITVFSHDDATRFGLDDTTDVTDLGVQQFIETAAHERLAGRAFTYVITLTSSRVLVGLLQVRQLDPAFQAAEWECTLVPASRGGGVFLDAARLAGSFAFETIGVHRLEARAPLYSGRANGALRKLGATQEGILRRSVRRNGEYVDQSLWALLREDWRDNWVSTAGRVH